MRSTQHLLSKIVCLFWNWKAQLTLTFFTTNIWRWVLYLKHNVWHRQIRLLLFKSYLSIIFCHPPGLQRIQQNRPFEGSLSKSEGNHPSPWIVSIQIPSWFFIDFCLHQSSSHVRSKICCFFKNLVVNYFTFTALHSANKYLNKQQIFRLQVFN